MAVLRASLIVSTLALLFSASTEAHVSMNPKFGEPGQVVDTAFRVPHGCNGSSTTAVLVHVPETITTIVPKDVANWVRYHFRCADKILTIQYLATCYYLS
jgi:uncharacterized protein YcnI